MGHTLGGPRPRLSGPSADLPRRRAKGHSSCARIAGEKSRGGKNRGAVTSSRGGALTTQDLVLSYGKTSRPFGAIFPERLFAGRMFVRTVCSRSGAAKSSGVNWTGVATSALFWQSSELNGLSSRGSLCPLILFRTAVLATSR